eukprot:CAMPEP_0116909672 /NCGR_PEP_ID=MMETSP0467-20121206/14413_1 /TAXON_ID=283647 /ORGANISM="Mesodinium pulex, Strain SPMC105" /LENGTH=63 /DNA_ID=CAMNT_0004585071 /DNA_START=434 /DNA_END=625 /DNA_ORIENTATION=+
MLGQNTHFVEAIASAGDRVNNISSIFRWSFYENQPNEKQKFLKKEDIETMPLLKWEDQKCKEK